MSEKREWWIVDSYMSGSNWISEIPLNDDHQEKSYEVHVIEYSAYDEAITALKKAEAERDEANQKLSSVCRYRDVLKEQRDSALAEVEWFQNKLKDYGGSLSFIEAFEELTKERDKYKSFAESCIASKCGQEIEGLLAEAERLRAVAQDLDAQNLGLTKERDELRAEVERLKKSDQLSNDRCVELLLWKQRMDEAYNRSIRDVRSLETSLNQTIYESDKRALERDNAEALLTEAESALEWYSLHWGTGDRARKTEGYKVAEETLTKIRGTK